VAGRDFGARCGEGETGHHDGEERRAPARRGEMVAERFVHSGGN
jgi:hypothetical protein